VCIGDLNWMCWVLFPRLLHLVILYTVTSIPEEYTTYILWSQVKWPEGERSKFLWNTGNHLQEHVRHYVETCHQHSCVLPSIYTAIVQPFVSWRLDLSLEHYRMKSTNSPARYWYFVIFSIPLLLQLESVLIINTHKTLIVDNLLLLRKLWTLHQTPCSRMCSFMTQNWRSGCMTQTLWLLKGKMQLIPVDSGFGKMFVTLSLE
jgi:hypothetical protein